MRARFVGRWYPPSVREPGPIFGFVLVLVQLFLCCANLNYRLVLRRLVSDGFVWLRDGCAKRLGRGRRVYTSRATSLTELGFLVPL